MRVWMKRIAEHLHRGLLLCLAVLLLTCAEEPRQEPPRAFLPVSGHVRLALPEGSPWNTHEMRILVGVIDDRPVRGTGADVVLNQNVPQLVVATSRDGHPLLLGIAIPSVRGTNVVLDARSTALALVFLSPFVVQADSVRAERLITNLEREPSTLALANLLDTRLRAGRNALDERDGEFLMALQSLVRMATHAVDELSRHTSSTGQPIIIDPNDGHALDRSVERSGLVVSATEGVGSDTTITVRNARKRFVAAFLHDGAEDLGSFLVLSRGSFVNTILNLRTDPSTSESRIYDSVAHPEAQLSVQGLAFRAPPTGVEWSRIFIPVVATVLFDYLLPLKSVITGINLLAGMQEDASALRNFASLERAFGMGVFHPEQVRVCPGLGNFAADPTGNTRAGSCPFLRPAIRMLNVLTSDRDLMVAVQAKVDRGDYPGALTEVITTGIGVFLSNREGILEAFVRAYAADILASVIIRAATYVAPIAGQVLLGAQIALTVADLGSGLIELADAQWVEEFALHRAPRDGGVVDEGHHGGSTARFEPSGVVGNPGGFGRIIQTRDGNFVIISTSQIQTTSQSQVILTKIDGLGAVIWRREHAGIVGRSEVAAFVESSTDGSLYAATTTVSGALNRVVAKFDSQGIALWSAGIGDFVTGLRVLSNNNVDVFTRSWTTMELNATTGEVVGSRRLRYDIGENIFRSLSGMPQAAVLAPTMIVRYPPNNGYSLYATVQYGRKAQPISEFQTVRLLARLGPEHDVQWSRLLSLPGDLSTGSCSIGVIADGRMLLTCSGTTSTLRPGLVMLSGNGDVMWIRRTADPSYSMAYQVGDDIVLGGPAQRAERIDTNGHVVWERTFTVPAPSEYGAIPRVSSVFLGRGIGDQLMIASVVQHYSRHSVVLTPLGAP